MAAPEGFSDKVAFVWKVADKLRGHFKPHEYGSVMLPLLVLRRLDAVLEPTKAQVLAKATELDARISVRNGVSSVFRYPAACRSRASAQTVVSSVPPHLIGCAVGRVAGAHA